MGQNLKAYLSYPIYLFRLKLNHKKTVFDIKFSGNTECLIPNTVLFNEYVFFSFYFEKANLGKLNFTNSKVPNRNPVKNKSPNTPFKKK